MWSLFQPINKNRDFVLNFKYFDNFLFLFFLIFIYFYFWPHHETCGILVPQPGIEPLSPALVAQRLNQWTAREVPQILFPSPLTAQYSLQPCRCIVVGCCCCSQKVVKWQVIDLLLTDSYASYVAFVHKKCWDSEYLFLIFL